MRRLLFLLALALLLPSHLSATWSIVAIDRATGRVVISSSTCAANSPDNLKQLQAIVLPGVGVAAAQASVDGTHLNQRLIFEQMRIGTDPKRIIEMLKEQEAAKVATGGTNGIEGRQFGIIDMKGGMAGFSGARNGNFSRDYQGASDDGKLYYSVQGNIIKTEEALIEAARVMKTDPSEMLERVMRAMETANSLGGDSRCSCFTGGGGATPGLPCTNRTTSVGYILAADPTDERGMYGENHPQVVGYQNYPGHPTDLRAPWNDGDYYLYIAVYPGNFGPNEDAAPVCTLRLRFDRWNAMGRPRMNLAADPHQIPSSVVPRTLPPPPPPAAPGAAAAGRGGGGGGGAAPGGAAAPGGRAGAPGGAAPAAPGGGAAGRGGGGGGGGAAPAQPAAPQTPPRETAACARAANKLPPAPTTPPPALSRLGLPESRVHALFNSR